MNTSKAEEALNRLTERIMRFSQWNGRLVPEDERDVETLRTFIAQAGEDAERLDFIADHARCDPKMDGMHVWWPTTFNNRLTGPTLREAVDRARSAAVAPTQEAPNGSL